VTRIVEAYFHLLKAAIALCLAVMVVLVFGNVVLRYLLNTGITVSEEVSRLLFVWLTFLGAIVAMREHGHLGVDWTDPMSLDRGADGDQAASRALISSKRAGLR
jgi:TRAP-type transport system small permease protein